MSTLTDLEDYLLGKDGDVGYLLNDDNNGKTVMLSGAWGSGKTHFWLEDIQSQLLEKKQKNIYISLYGRESIHELKFEVLKEAYNLEVKEDIISKSASMLSSIAPSLGEKSLVDGFDKLNKKAKDKKAEEILKSGSIICLDDFERKSTKINLNDLFGYISQLALDYHCKVVIILNSDVFEGEEANVFKTVKEKTVNKFFYFEPTPEELFESIYESNTNYKRLDKYRSEILKAIKETEELNARIYIQVLDNCLEWIDKGYSLDVIKVLVLTTINFNLNHILLEYVELAPVLSHKHMGSDDTYTYNILEKYHEVIQGMSILECRSNNFSEYTFLDVKTHIHREVKRKGKEQIDIYSEQIQKIILDELIENDKELKAIWKYGYQLYCMNTAGEDIYNLIIKFVKSGIILPKKEEQSS